MVHTQLNSGTWVQAAGAREAGRKTAAAAAPGNWGFLFSTHKWQLQEPLPRTHLGSDRDTASLLYFWLQKSDRSRSQVKRIFVAHQFLQQDYAGRNLCNNHSKEGAWSEESKLTIGYFPLGKEMFFHVIISWAHLGDRFCHFHGEAMQITWKQPSCNKGIKLEWSPLSLTGHCSPQPQAPSTM